PALRGLLRGDSAVHPALRRRAAPCEAAPRGRHGVVSGGLRGGPHVGRTVPATGPAIGFPDFRHDNGPAIVDSVADRRHPDHRLGATRARSCPLVSEEIADKIVRRIRAEGPLKIAAYMAIALHDPEGGYYARREPIGAAGDFTTAPEISQIFGELIGLWCAELWEGIGRPDPVILAELGPGRGVLMSDLLRAAGSLPEFRRALRVFLVEASPVLRAEQERRLCQARPAWVRRVEELPDGPMLMVANEFLDALPIRQFVRGVGGWSERMVTVDPENHLVFVDGPESPVASLLVPGAMRHCAPGAIVEICPAALALAGALGSRLARQPGAALFID